MFNRNCEASIVSFNTHIYVFDFSLQTYWTEFIQLSNIRQMQRDAADAWLRTCLRYVGTSKHSSSASKTKKHIDPAGKLHNDY